MPRAEFQRESRIGENPTYGLVYGAKPMRPRRRGFTLIERMPSKADGYLLGESPNSANFPFRADSLTLRSHRVTGAGYGVTMSREGSHGAMADDGLYLRHSVETPRQRIAGRLRRLYVWARSQSERLGKRTGRRMTNVRKHRKVYYVCYRWQRRRIWVASHCSIDEACHSRGSKWEHAPAKPDGVKGGGMCGQICRVKSGESLYGPTGGWVRIGIRDHAESRADAVQEVGDGHSTLDPADRTTVGEGRPISLELPSREEVPA